MFVYEWNLPDEKRVSVNTDRLINDAAGALRAGRLELAVEHARAALQLDPACIPAKLILSLVHVKKEEDGSAESILREVLAVEPNTYEALVSLATICRESGRVDESIALGRKAVSIIPNEVQGLNNLGRSLLAARKLSESADVFHRVVKFQPSFAAAHLNLGKTLQLQGNDAEAAKSFAQAAALSPSLENLLAHGQMQLTLGNFEAAVRIGIQCTATFPNSATAHLLLCGALTKCNRGPEAETQLQRAIELDSDGKEVLQIAYRQRPLGHIEAANENFRKAIEQNPNRVAAYEALVQNQKVTEADRHLVEKMLTLLRNGALSGTELASIHYGLGKALEDLHEYGDSMHHYDEANRITRAIKIGSIRFDRDRYALTVDRMIDLYPNSKRRLENADESDLPILIVGMMRSGTSLAEQILSNHPDVEGAGEQLFWPQNWANTLTKAGREVNFKILERLGRQYVRALSEFGEDSKRVTDKMPGNYIFSGPIHLALPNARIIHMRRNPIDTCVSIWVTPNQMPHEGGHEKANIAFVYTEYMRLMAFWRQVLPPDRFLEVDYESLISDPENSIRSMLRFCGLGWDEACLKPHENRRLVITPSTWQIRQPFYKTSIERWRKFEPWLEEFSSLVDLRHPRN